jgi:hypothetical protein
MYIIAMIVNAVSLLNVNKKTNHKTMKPNWIGATYGHW